MAWHWFTPRCLFLLILCLRCPHSLPYLRPSPNFNSSQSAYKFFAGSLPLPTPLYLFNRQQFGCWCFSISLRRVSLFNRSLSRCRFIARSLHRSDTRLLFQPPAMRLPVRCTLSTSFRRASPISTACNTVKGALPALYLVPMRLSLFNCYLSPYMFTASVNLSNREYIELAIRIE